MVKEDLTICNICLLTQQGIHFSYQMTMDKITKIDVKSPTFCVLKNSGKLILMYMTAQDTTMYIVHETNHFITIPIGKEDFKRQLMTL